MRLSARQADVIREGAKACFGGGVRAWLFGSRVDDGCRGGDIDLYIEPEQEDAARLIEAKLRFLMWLHRALGEQKIDVVLRRKGSQRELPIYHIARREGVRLL